LNIARLLWRLISMSHFATNTSSSLVVVIATISPDGDTMRFPTTTPQPSSTPPLAMPHL
jgi:hypothetical protein